MKFIWSVGDTVLVPTSDFNGCKEVRITKRVYTEDHNNIIIEYETDLVACDNTFTQEELLYYNKDV